LFSCGSAANDTRGLKALPFNLPPHSIVYCDLGYTDYWAEDEFQEHEAISLLVMRKGNSQRPDPPWLAYIKQHQRHLIETVFSQITQPFPKSIHAVTLDGFLLEVTAFILVFALQSAFTL
jgi:hypothetical protein